MNNVRPLVGADPRKRRCARCGNGYLPPGAGNGMCSDDCWVASRGRQLTQGQQLGRTVQAMAFSHERRVIGRARVDRLLADAELDGTVQRYHREVTETLGLIS